MESAGAAVPAFVAAVVDVGPGRGASSCDPASEAAAALEGERGGTGDRRVAVKISRGADAGVIAAVIEALRATR